MRQPAFSKGTSNLMYQDCQNNSAFVGFLTFVHYRCVFGVGIT